MEIWLIYAISSVFLAGLYNFILKVSTERNYNISFINICHFFVMIVFAFIYLLFTLKKIQYSEIIITLTFAFFNALLFSVSIFSRTKSLKNIDTVIFFPLYKTIGPIIVILISLFFFNETLTNKEVIGIISGISVPLLLLTKKENKIQKNLFLGVILILVTSILTSISSAFCKEIVIRNFSIPLFILGVSVFGLIFSFFTNNYKKHNNHKFNNNGVLKFGLISGIIAFFNFLVFLKALEGKFAVVFTINSFSILIPIILSIIVYKEHWNLRKAVVIILSIISILLFI